MEKNIGGNSLIQVHIISAGKGMNETLKIALRRYSISSVIVFRESSEDRNSNRKIQEINDAESKMRETAKILGISFEVKSVMQNDMNDVRDKVLSLTKKYKNVKFFFNLTHGRKILSFYLLTMAVWLDGTPYYIDENGNLIEFRMPKMHVDEIFSNKNFFRILQILHDSSVKEAGWSRYKDIYEETSIGYKSKKNVKGGRSEKLSMGAYSKWVRRLVETHMIEEKFKEGSNKSKVLRLTDDGTFTYMFLKDQFP